MTFLSLLIMNERLLITIPASMAVWIAIFALVTFALHRGIVRPATNHDTITVRMVSIPPKPIPPLPKPPVKPAAPRKPVEKTVLPPLPIAAAPQPTPIEAEPTTVPVETAPPPAPMDAKSISHGAAISQQPVPKIPDDLRREAYSMAVLVRFHVAADGSATIELLTPSQNPRLNRFLLESLNSWNFTPAVKNGSPLASTIDIRVHFAVE
jgi:protein TonB